MVIEPEEKGFGREGSQANAAANQNLRVVHSRKQDQPYRDELLLSPVFIKTIPGMLTECYSKVTSLLCGL